MLAKLVEVVNTKIEEEKLLVIGVDWGGSHETNAVIPDRIDTDENGIHIEGENLMLDIASENAYNVSFNENEEEFVITQGQVTFYLS